MTSPFPLSAVEAAQLGRPTAGRYLYTPQHVYDAVRAATVRRRSLNYGSRGRAPSFALDPELTAYTPGETLGLLQHPQVTAWHSAMRRHEVPAEAEVVVLVPCAASKPWGPAHSVGAYRAYNNIRARLGSSVYFATISEPLGIVPQERWDSFPGYDNPGLFRDTPMRSGLLSRDWLRDYGQVFRLPWDAAAARECMSLLGQEVGTWLHRQRRPGRVFLSFVDARKGVAATTHGQMLDYALLGPERPFVVRSPKNEHARQGAVKPNSRGRSLEQYFYGRIVGCM